MVSRFMTSSFLLIHTRSSEFGFLFYPLVYLRVWGNNLILECFLKRLSTGFSHQASVFKIHASVHVQLSPMTFCSTRREALSQPPIGQTLQCRVNPTETKSFFLHSMYGIAGHSGHLPRQVITQQHFSSLWFSSSHCLSSEREDRCNKLTTSILIVTYWSLTSLFAIQYSL